MPEFRDELAMVYNRIKPMVGVQAEDSMGYLCPLVPSQLMNLRVRHRSDAHV